MGVVKEAVVCLQPIGKISDLVRGMCGKVLHFSLFTGLGPEILIFVFCFSTQSNASLCQLIN